ncbi:MAG: hypothetical protein EBR82_30750 [Caulobacteraceae bacterium]|nr:hypothetical protein [Caulobacteraceae bacterium]
MGEPSDFSIAAIAAWVRRNVGGLGNLLNIEFSIDATTLEITPNLTDVQKYIFKKMYSIYFFDIKIKSAGSLALTDYVSIKDDFGSVQKLNTNEVLKSFYQIRKQEYEELKSLVDTYNINEITPLQVAGDDTISSSYSFERDALYNIRTIYNAG